MSRVRVVLGLLAVTVGTAWWADGLSAVLAGVVGVAPYLLLAVAAVGGARAFVPRGVLVGPAILLAAGLVWLLLRFDLIGSWGLRSVVAGALVFGGFALALTRRSGESEPAAVRRIRALAWPRKVRLEGAAPWKMSAVSALGRLTVDLTGPAFPGSFPVMEIDVTVLAGRVDLVLPNDWSVALGRVHSLALHFDGVLDLPRPVRYPADLAELKLGGKWVLVNILGLAGSVTLEKRAAQR